MKKCIHQVCLIGGLLASASMAMAVDKVDYVNIQKDGINLADGKVYIKPNNGNYGTASKSTVSYHVKVRAGCKWQNEVKSAFVAFGEEYASGTVIEYSDNYKQDVLIRHGQKTMPWTAVHLQVPLTKLGFNPAAMCQDYLNNKISQGVSKQQVLAQDHVINQSVKISAVARCGKPGKSGDQYGTAKMGTGLKIICKSGSVAGVNNIQVQPSKPKPGVNAIQAQFQVTNATLKATPYKLSTTCPAKAKFTGTISANGPGTVQYQILFPGSDKTGIRNLHFNKAGTKSIGIVEYPTDHSLPVASATLKVLSPGNKKAYAHFKVLCITPGPGGVSDVQQQPQQMQLQINKPVPKMQLQIKKDESEPVRR